jgi:hypothetical protein
MCGHHPSGFGGNKNWVKGRQGKKERKNVPLQKLLVALKTSGQFKIFCKE